MSLKKMKNAPVYYVVGQIRFNLVSDMEDFVKKIQGGYRKLGYTLFEQNDTQSLQIEQQPESVTGRVVKNRSWFFSQSDRHSGFILGESFVTFHTTHYESRDHLIKSLLDGFHIVNEAVGLEHTSRVGLRYLDAVLPSKDETVDLYLKSEISAFNVGRAKPVSDFWESLFFSELESCDSKGALVARIKATFGKLGYPPDMVPNSLIPKKEFAMDHSCQHAILDVDHHVNVQMPIGADLMSVFVELHGHVESVFLDSISEHALEVWK